MFRLLTALLAALLMGLGGAPTPSFADRPAARPAPVRSTVVAGRIAFQLASGGAIISGPADGSDWRLVTTGLDPALSPAGRELALARWGNGAGIVIVDLATGSERRLSEDREPRDPSWSPDGRQIAYYERADAVQTVGRRLIPDNTFITTVVDTATGERFQVPGGSFLRAPAWSPDGRRLAVQGHDGLYLIDLAAANPWPVKVPNTTGEFAQPVWSPDGTALAAMVHRTGRWDIVRIDLAGGTRVLTDPTAAERVERSLTGPAAKPIDNVSPAWSPDGTRLAFASNRDGAWAVYSLPARGGPATKLIDGPFQYGHALERVLSWSPDPGTPITGSPWRPPAPPAALPVAIAAIEPQPLGRFAAARVTVRTEAGAAVRVAVRYCGSLALSGSLQTTQTAGEDGMAAWSWIAVPGLCRGPEGGSVTATATKDGRTGQTTAHFAIE